MEMTAYLYIGKDKSVTTVYIFYKGKDDIG